MSQLNTDMVAQVRFRTGRSRREFTLQLCHAFRLSQTPNPPRIPEFYTRNKIHKLTVPGGDPE